jgi:hypothetical protein
MTAEDSSPALCNIGQHSSLLPVEPWTAFQSRTVLTNDIGGRPASSSWAPIRLPAWLWQQVERAWRLPHELFGHPSIATRCRETRMAEQRANYADIGAPRVDASQSCGEAHAG